MADAVIVGLEPTTTPTPTPPAKAGEVIREVIKEVVVYPPDVNKVVEAARVQEKEKLHNKINAAEGIERENQLLREKIARIESQGTPVTNSTPTPTPTNVPAVNPPVADIARIAAEAAVAAMAPIAQGIKDDVSKQLNESNLASYKSAAIAAARGRIIPSLVSGSTTAEIDISVMNAKAAFENAMLASGIQIPAAATPTPASPSIPTPTTRTQAPIVPPPAQVGIDNQPVSNEEQALAASVKGMDRNTYKTNRLDIRKKLKSIVAERTGGNPFVK